MRNRNLLRVWPIEAAMLTAVAFASCAYATNTPALNTLAVQLRQARSLPAGAVTHFQCPPHMDQFVGMLGANIQTSLGKPDYIDDGADAPRVKISWSYFLMSPRRHEVATDNTVIVSAGGGFPVITFHVGTSDKVEHAECSYAR
jgi:hypothetical protein